MRSFSQGLCVLLFVSSLAGQSHVHAPAASSAGDQNSMSFLAGFDRDARQQILVDQIHLAGFIGREIDGLAVRRDRGWRGALSPGRSDLTVVVSRSPRDAIDISPVFAANFDPDPAQRHVVFAGVVDLPASSEPAGRSFSWDDAEDAIELPFSATFVYGGGTLCVDIVGVRVVGSESPFWPVDAAIDPVVGQVASVGTPCGQPAGLAHAYPSSSVAAYALIPGATARFRGYGAPGIAGGVFIGAPSAPFDLSWIGVGAPGCTLHVQPFVVMPAFYEPLPGGVSIGVARVMLDIPAVQSSLGFSFRAQFLSVAGSVESTNALDCVVAASPPSLGMSTVFADTSVDPAPTRGVAQSNRAPALRLRWR